jgi:methionine aminopeptidase
MVYSMEYEKDMLRGPMIRVKNERQIEGIRASCQMLSDMYEELRPLVRPGITPEELDTFAYDFIIRKWWETGISWI